MAMMVADLIIDLMNLVKKNPQYLYLPVHVMDLGTFHQPRPYLSYIELDIFQAEDGLVLSLVGDGLNPDHPWVYNDEKRRWVPDVN